MPQILNVRVYEHVKHVWSAPHVYVHLMGLVEQDLTYLNTLRASSIRI